MRWVLVVAFCIAAGATAWGGATEKEGTLRVTIGYALPTADPEDSDNRLGNRYWDVSPPVIVESERWCDRAELTTRIDLFFNDRPLARDNDGASEEELSGNGHRFEARALGPGDASAGETVRFTATARCSSRGEVTAGSATRTFELPKASCDLGPLRVGEVSGDVSVLDWNHWNDESDRRVLRAGHVVNGGSEVRIEPGGKVELGEPECNGFRVTLFEGEHVVGGYDREGRGSPFTAERAAAVGDAHAGGISVPGRATVWPLDNRCRGCHASQPSSYEVRSTAKRVTVRVYGGAVLVGGPEGARSSASQRATRRASSAPLRAAFPPTYDCSMATSPGRRLPKTSPNHFPVWRPVARLSRAHWPHRFRGSARSSFPPPAVRLTRSRSAGHASFVAP